MGRYISGQMAVLQCQLRNVKDALERETDWKKRLQLAAQHDRLLDRIEDMALIQARTS